MAETNVKISYDSEPGRTLGSKISMRGEPFDCIFGAFKLNYLYLVIALRRGRFILISFRMVIYPKNSVLIFHS